MKLADIFAIIAGMTPFITSLIQLAEKTLSGQEGAVKKENVMGVVQAGVSGMIAISQGPQKDTWKGVNDAMPVISTLVDSTVSMLNATGAWDKPNIENLQPSQ